MIHTNNHHIQTKRISFIESLLYLPPHHKRFLNNLFDQNFKSINNAYLQKCQSLFEQHKQPLPQGSNWMSIYKNSYFASEFLILNKFTRINETVGSPPQSSLEKVIDSNCSDQKKKSIIKGLILLGFDFNHVTHSSKTILALLDLKQNKVAFQLFHTNIMGFRDHELLLIGQAFCLNKMPDAALNIAVMLIKKNKPDDALSIASSLALNQKYYHVNQIQSCMSEHGHAIHVRTLILILSAVGFEDATTFVDPFNQNQCCLLS